MNIEEIMKPYFDKKEELERKQEINNKYLEERTLINLRLERLRDNKDREIEEYVQNAVSDRPDFYAGYGAMIRKDLEQAYTVKEQELKNQIQELEEKMESNSQELRRYHRVDVRELVDVKHELRKSLTSAKKELEIRLREAELRFDAVMYKLSTFKHQYDEEHNILNGDEYRTLFEQSNSLIDVKYSIQKELEQVDKYLKLTELTEEEVKTIMMSMTDLEKEEYNRRKMVSTISQNVEEQLEQETPIVEEIIPEQPVAEDVSSNEIKEDEDSIYEQAQAAIENKIKLEEEQSNLIEENYSKFIEEISTDVLSCVKRLRSVEIKDGKVTQITPGKQNKEYELSSDSAEQIELVNGLYLNRHDVEKAARNYKRQNKGRTFTVKGKDLALNVTRKSVNKVKEVLRKFSLKDLLSEKKISIFDVKRVYGKEKAEEYTNNDSSIEFKAEEYIRVRDAYEAFKHLFVEKSPTWIERLTSKFKKRELPEEEMVLDADYEQIDDTMSWDADEPEYEVVKARSK